MRYCYSVLDPEDIKEIAKIASCSESLVRAVGRSERSNDDVEFLIYQKSKAKAQRCLVVCEQIENKNRETIDNRHRRNLVINFDN